MKGIILAGGAGTRLHPNTLVVSKQLLPVYDKPMIYYPLSVLMLAGIKEILIITTPEDNANFKKLLGDGSQWGIDLVYAVQPRPEGLAQAFLIGEKFIDNDSVCLILGDNIFYGAGFQHLLKESVSMVEEEDIAMVFGYNVEDPKSYGIAEIDDNGNVVSIEEKPNKPKSNNAVVGIYFYPNSVKIFAKEIEPSERGELEITSINQKYLKDGNLKLKQMGRGYAWLDTGTHESLSEANEFVKTIEKRTSLKIACLEEIAYRMKFIRLEKLKKSAQNLSKSSYGDYIMKIYNQSANE